MSTTGLEEKREPKLLERVLDALRGRHVGAILWFSMPSGKRISLHPGGIHIVPGCAYNALAPKRPREGSRSLIMKCASPYIVPGPASYTRSDKRKSCCSHQIAFSPPLSG